MIDILSYQKQLAEQGYQAPYIVQLLLEKKAYFQKEPLFEALKRNCGNIEPMEKESGLLAFAHMDHMTRFQEGPLPVQYMFTDLEELPDHQDWIAQSLYQTWDWQEAKDAVKRSRYMITITDMLASGMERKSRLNVFHGVIRSALDQVKPMAIHWLPSQRVINPQRYSEDLANGQIYYSSAVNVRMFRVENSDERIMDTMGLYALGVPDLQCHFLKLDPSQVGLLLYEYAEYLVEKGDVIRDGHTVQGLAENQKWTCRHEKALVDPQRTVIDIHPGEFSPGR